MSSNRTTALIELVIFVPIALGLKEVLDPFIWRYSGPASLIATIALLTVYYRLKGQTWASMGLIRFESVKSKLLLLPQAILVFACVLVTLTLLTKGLEAAGFQFMSEPIEGEEKRWGDIQGNLRQYLILLGLSWVSAGFAEEMFFRGFVITRLQNIFNGPVMAVALSAVLFGYVHLYYQGLAGFVNAAVIGVIFATLFLLFKRNLWPLILAHGFINSLGFTAEFMGWAI